MNIAIKPYIELLTNEKEVLIELYRNYYKKHNGLDYFDAFLKLTNIDSREFIKKNIKNSTKNFKEACDNLLNSHKLILFYEHDKLIGCTKFLKEKKNIVFFDLVLIDETTEKLKQVILFLESVFRKSKKISIEVLSKDVKLLLVASELAYREDPKNIMKENKYILTKEIKDDDLIILVNKDEGFTSRDVVNVLSGKLGVKKIGHTGTLDPMATGVMVCVTGKYTKLVNELSGLDKEYIATIKLGIKTDTLDTTGKILEKSDVKEIKLIDVINTLKTFDGFYEQTIPKYSAVHLNGKRLYEYARNNEEIELPKRVVDIKEIELIRFDNEEIEFRVIVSKGTYIRSLIQDICDRLGTIGSMSKLIRTRLGKFKLEDAYRLDDENKKIFSLEEVINMSIIETDEKLFKKVFNGNEIQDSYDGYVLYKKDNKKIALYKFNNNIGKLVILF